MNTHINRKLNEAIRNVAASLEVKRVGEEVTMAHNIAVANGFIELPILDFVGAEKQDNAIAVDVKPRSGMIELNDLYNLKTTWGASRLEVYDAKGLVVSLIFKTN